jgi:hypothetical protein
MFSNGEGVLDARGGLWEGMFSGSLPYDDSDRSEIVRSLWPRRALPCGRTTAHFSRDGTQLMTGDQSFEDPQQQEEDALREKRDLEESERAAAHDLHEEELHIDRARYEAEWKAQKDRDRAERKAEREVRDAERREERERRARERNA